MKDIIRHSNNVTCYAIMIGQALNLNDYELDILLMACKYHDIGKIRIQKNIIDKPDKLTEVEYTIVKSHTMLSKNIFETVEQKYKYKDICSKIILYHHENFDGTGYYKLKGEDIPLLARIIRVADVFAALTEERCYKASMNTYKALKIMLQEKYIYDPVIYKLFISLIKEINISDTIALQALG